MNIITTKEQLKDLVEFYSKVEAFAFDVETVGENRIQPVVNDVMWISLATEGRTDVIPMGHPNGEFLRWDKEFWEISRLGMGPTTQYTLNFVRGRDLAEEWKLSSDAVAETVAAAVPFTAEVIRETPRSEMLEVARSVA